MRASISFFLPLTALCAVHAQPTWQRLYESAPSYTFDLIELPSHHLITPLSRTMRVDPQGYFEHVSLFHGGGTFGVQTLKQVAANEFFFNTGRSVGPCMGNPVVGKMDSMGTVLAMRGYDLNTGLCHGTPAARLEVTSDNGALTWGRDHGFYAMRVDSTLELVWSRKVIRSGGFQFIKELPSGDLLAGINMDTAGVVVARMDADGNFLWSKSYVRPKGMIHDALIESDSSFIITGYTDSTQQLFTEPLPSTFQPKLFMMKLDGDGEVHWCKGWFSAPFLWYTGMPSKVRRTLDGQYAVLSTLGVPANNFHYHPFLMKTDTNGDTLWTRAVGENGYVHLAQDLLVHSDGGYMFSGVTYGDLPNGNSGMPFIYKTDSLGRFDCLEHSNPVQVLDLFPVDSAFVLTSVASEATATTILVNDSILDPNLFPEFDGCTLLPLQVPPVLAKRRPLTIRPNPNAGRFTVEFADPLIAESYHSVYDALGKLLYQRPLPAGAMVEEIDLSRFGRGTYVLKITDPEGSRYERVVLE